MAYLKSKLSPYIVSLYSNRVIQDIAGGLLGLFLPIFLYTKFDSITSVLAIYLISFGVYFIIAPIGARIASRINFRWALVLSVPFGALYYLCLYFFDYNPWFFIALSLVFINIDRMFYWVPFHTNLANFTNKRDRGRSLALLNSSAQLISIFLPIVAGFIIAVYGYPLLYLIVFFIYLVSVVPFLFLSNTDDQYNFSYWETWRILFHPRERRLLITYVADGAQDVVNLVIWPIFIWQVLEGDFKTVGIVYSLIILVTILIRLITGKYVDKLNKKKILKLGSLLYSSGWILKTFVETGWQIFAATTFHNITAILMRSPFDTLMYEKATDMGEYIDEYSVLREMALSLGRVLMLAVLIIVVPLFSFKLSFVLAAIISLFVNFI